MKTDGCNTSKSLFIDQISRSLHSLMRYYAIPLLQTMPLIVMLTRPTAFKLVSTTCAKKILIPGIQMIPAKPG